MKYKTNVGRPIKWDEEMCIMTIRIPKKERDILDGYCKAQGYTITDSMILAIQSLNGDLAKNYAILNKNNEQMKKELEIYRAKNQERITKEMKEEILKQEQQIKQQKETEEMDKKYKTKEKKEWITKNKHIVLQIFKKYNNKLDAIDEIREISKLPIGLMDCKSIIGD